MVETLDIKKFEALPIRVIELKPHDILVFDLSKCPINKTEIAVKSIPRIMKHLAPRQKFFMMNDNIEIGIITKIKE